MQNLSKKVKIKEIFYKYTVKLKIQKIKFYFTYFTNILKI